MERAKKKGGVTSAEAPEVLSQPTVDLREEAERLVAVLAILREWATGDSRLDEPPYTTKSGRGSEVDDAPSS